MTEFDTHFLLWAETVVLVYNAGKLRRTMYRVEIAKMNKIALGFIFLISGCGFANYGQILTERFSAKHVIYSDCGISYELRALSVKYLAGHIFLIVEDRNFNEKALTALFRCLSNKHPEFASLNITAFSDRDNLDVAIKEHFHPPPDVSPPLDKEWDCENVRRGRRPCPLGYFRAIYLRFDEREFFDFSEDAGKVPLTRVLLRKPKEQ